MVTGDWSGHRFPVVEWTDVGGLLKKAGSQRQLKSFPTNPFSSQSQPTCTEGAMALWMVEALRKDSMATYPSLNPLILGAGDTDESWQASSDRNMPRAVDAYERWWSRVRRLPISARRRDDPLVGTGLHWY